MTYTILCMAALKFKHIYSADNIFIVYVHVQVEIHPFSIQNGCFHTCTMLPFVYSEREYKFQSCHFTLAEENSYSFHISSGVFSDIE